MLRIRPQQHSPPPLLHPVFGARRINIRKPSEHLRLPGRGHCLYLPHKRLDLRKPQTRPPQLSLDEVRGG